MWCPRPCAHTRTGKLRQHATGTHSASATGEDGEDDTPTPGLGRAAKKKAAAAAKKAADAAKAGGKVVLTAPTGKPP